MRHTLVKKKNFIINCVIIKSHVKVHKNVKNIMKRSLNEKRKHILTQQKKNHIINSTINTELIVKSMNNQENMLNEKSVNA